ncbi:MAG: hypothetical protein J6O13_13700 [Selenomonas sp.]|nr:hypothetical protein [Selenomonas sp.]
MPDALNRFLPFVEDFDEEATLFLKRYCPEVFESPQPVPIKDIATAKMNLDIVDTESLSPDDSVQGAITFSGGIIDVYDWDSEEYVGYEVKFPTVFVDTNIANPGRINNILAHECYHWYKHRRYFIYGSSHQESDGFGFRCPPYQHRTEPKTTWSDVEKMEWQSRTVAPKILMPKSTVKMMISQYLHDAPKETVSPTVLKEFVEIVAKTYAVSRHSAAIRISELGYPAAYDIYASEAIITDRLPLKRQTAAKKRQQPITLAAAFELYLGNEFLREILNTGAFCFADGYFTRRDEKYVLPNEKGFTLTDYARGHLSECTLDFSYKLIGTPLADGNAMCMLSAGREYKKQPTFDSHNPQNIEAYNRAKETLAKFEEQFKRTQLMVETTTQRMWKYMELKQWDKKTFTNQTLLDDNEYYRVKGGTHIFSIASYTAMAVGLELSLTETQDALHLSGMDFDRHKRDEFAYMFVLGAYPGCTMNEFNTHLKELNVAPIVRKEKQPRTTKKKKDEQ